MKTRLSDHSYRGLAVTHQVQKSHQSVFSPHLTCYSCLPENRKVIKNRRCRIETGEVKATGAAWTVSQRLTCFTPAQRKYHRMVEAWPLGCGRFWFFAFCWVVFFLFSTI